MTTRRLAIGLTVLIAVFMTGTVVIALWQEDLGWGWWWAVPLGGVFIVLILVFRVLVHRAQEAAEAADREADNASHGTSSISATDEEPTDQYR